MFRFLTLAVIAMSIFPIMASAQDYEIKSLKDGAFKFEIMGQGINQGSSLKRKSHILIESDAPVVIIGHHTDIIYKDRGFRFSSSTTIEPSSPIQAIEIRTMQYDVFGEHMQNLSNTEVKDISGRRNLSAEWSARSSEISEYLNSFTYVARVRLANGKKWEYDENTLVTALREVGLESTNLELSNE